MGERREKLLELEELGAAAQLAEDDREAAAILRNEGAAETRSVSLSWSDVKNFLSSPIVPSAAFKYLPFGNLIPYAATGKPDVAQLTPGEALEGTAVVAAGIGTAGLGAARVTNAISRIGHAAPGVLSTMTRHPVVTALGSGTGLKSVHYIAKQGVSALKRRKKAAAKEKVAAEKAALRAKIAELKAQAKLTKASAPRAAKRSTRGRAGRRRGARKMTALQLKYFGKGHK